MLYQLKSSQFTPSNWYSLSLLLFLYSLELSDFFQSSAGGRSCFKYSKSPISGFSETAYIKATATRPPYHALCFRLPGQQLLKLFDLGLVYVLPQLPRAVFIRQ